MASPGSPFTSAGIRLLRGTLMVTFRTAVLAAAICYFVIGGAVTSPAELTVEIGGAPMYPSRNIIENVVNSKDHTTFVAALNAAGLAETLRGGGPFTVFAPVNKAFDKLPKGTADTV